MVEAGFTYKEIQRRAIQNNACEMLLSANTCLVTHNHGDHCIGVPELIKRGVRVYASKEVFEKVAPGKEKPNMALTFPDQDYCIAPDLFCHTVAVKHDAPNSMGFIIVCTKTKEKVLFINDCKYVESDLSIAKYDYIFIECNYEDKQTRLLHAMAQKDEDRVKIAQYKRIIDAHMSLRSCIKTLNKMDLTKCKQIFLMHLSDRNANEYQMKREVNEKTGIPTAVCLKVGGIK